jgi:uncharacterized protein (DUF433 family)
MQFEPTQHIEIRDSRVVGPKPYNAGTRISVEDVYVCHDLRGMTPDEIVAAFPHVTFAQVYAAMAYFHDHASEIREQMRVAADFAGRLEAEQGPTRFARLRESLAVGASPADAPVSP